MRSLGGLPVIAFLKRLYGEVYEDDILGLAAQCAFAWAFALFPFLLFVVAAASYLPGAEGQLPAEIATQLPSDVRTILERRLAEMATQGRTSVLTIAFLLTLWSASGGAATLVFAVNRAYEVKEVRPFWKRRLIGLVLILAGAVLVFLPSFYTAVGGVIAGLLERTGLGVLAVLVDWLRWPLMVAGAAAWLMLLYNVGPEDRPHWRFFSPGILFSLAGFLAVNRGLSFYVERSGRLGVTYGIFGGFIILLLWLYAVSAVLLVGAEINALTEKAEHERRTEGAPRRGPARIWRRVRGRA